MSDDTALHRYRSGFLKYRSVLFDRATGLPAFPLLIDDLRQGLDQRRQVGVVHVEYRQLGRVESLYGWQVLDRILLETASLLRATLGQELPESALIAINGVAGDRFVIFALEQHDGSEVDEGYLNRLSRELCRRLDGMLRQPEFRGLSPKLTPRAGHALIFQDPFYRFERRVYAAVEEASLGAERHDADPRERQEIERILEQGAIDTLFQPIFDLSSGSVLGYEALARGPRDSALEMPRALFSLSNRLGQAVRLDRVCRERALEAAEALTGPEMLFLNVLPESFEGSAELGPAPAGERDRARTVLEFSERAMADDPDGGSELFDSLRAQGHTLALDDVGSAFDSRRLIERLRPNYLKLDGSLVRKVDENLIKQELLSNLVDLSAELGATLIAKNVETDREARVLREAGASFGQGFLYGAPASADFGAAAAGREH